MKVFDLQGNNTNLVSEILAGVTSFVTMSYLLVQCPDMIGGHGAAKSTIYISMCITCFIGCILMGVWAKQPFVIGPSIGLSAYFTAMLMTELKYDYAEALAIAFFAGLIYVALSLGGLGNMIFSALSGSMKNGISAGLGLYIAMIGLKNSGFLITGEGGNWKFAEMSVINEDSFAILIMFAGLVFIGFFKRIGMPFPPLLGILASGALYYGGGKFFGLVNFSLFKPGFNEINGNFGTWYKQGFLINLTKGMGGLFSGMKPDVKLILTLIITILVCTMFNATESAGVVYAMAKNHGKFDEHGNFGGLKNTIASNSVASVIGTLFGCPMVAVAPTAVTAGILFLLAAFFEPVVTYIPATLTACVMVYIGFTMLGAVKEIDCSDIGEGVPALLTITLIPLTSSIIDGIAIGIIMHIVVNICIFKLKAIKPIEFIIAFLFGLHYFFL